MINKIYTKLYIYINLYADFNILLNNPMACSNYSLLTKSFAYYKFSSNCSEVENKFYSGFSSSNSSIGYNYSSF
jgi:hypothetical protein